MENAIGPKLKNLRNYKTFGEFHWSQAPKPMELPQFWRIPLVPSSKTYGITILLETSIGQLASQPASQPASAPNQPWITFSTRLLPEVPNRLLLPMRFFKHSILENSRPASQPIQYLAGRVTTSVYQNAFGRQHIFQTHRYC